MPWIVKRRLPALCALGLSLGALVPHAWAAVERLPQAMSGELPQLTMVGRGELKWFGLRVYEASLWTPEGRFHDFPRHAAVALDIQYARNIPGERLVASARSEWGRLAIDDPRIDAWCESVARIWPDVGPGDSITTIVERDGPTRFFFNDAPIGVVDDPDFGPALLTIWLHPASRSERLRLALLGERR